MKLKYVNSKKIEIQSNINLYMLVGGDTPT